MGITKILSKIFELNSIEYDYIENLIPESAQHAWTANSINLSNLANISLLKTPDSLVFAVYPASHHINLAKVIKIFNTPVHYLNISAINTFIQQNDELNIDEIITKHDIKLIIDIEISDLDTVLFKNNSDKHYLSVNTSKLENLILEIPIGCQFSDTKPEYIHEPNLTFGAPRLDLSTKINNIETLPILPEIASQILQLQSNPDASVQLLSEIVSKDPALTSLILKYANSALFGLRDSVESVYDAILRVLGFDTVLYLAIGLAMGNSFKLDKNGPLGSKMIWQHAVYSAAICQKLSQKCPAEFRPSPGKAYLAGLLHDIGYLVLASSFETEYFWLNKLIASKPEVPMTVIEQQLLGVQHTELGNVLLTNWNMPEFLTISVTEHHNEGYCGNYCEISGLVLLVDRALKSYTDFNASSDAFTTKLPEELVYKLGLTNEIIFESVEEVFDCSENLNIMVSAMTA